MKNISMTLLISFLCACGEKENAEETQAQSFEDFQTQYFSLNQDNLDQACSEWYDDCIDEGYAAEDCGIRLEECEEGDWEDGGDEGDREDEEREDGDREDESDREDEEGEDEEREE